jgi:putative transposase
MVEIVFSRNCVYQFAYHLVWCPKYRHRVLIGPIASAMDNMINQICQENQWSVIAKEIQPDHIHLFLTIPPSISISHAIKTLKGASARKLFVRFPRLKQKLWGGHLWSPSYFAATAGNDSAEIITKYIERAEHIGGRQ